MARQLDLVVENATLVSGRQVDIAVANEKIAGILEAGFGEDLSAERRIDAAGLTALPGVVDAHVHLNWPLSEDPAIGMYSETKAAAAGGVTLLGNYPLGVDGDLLVHLEETRELIDRAATVDVAISYPILNVEQIDQMDALFDAGITSFKMLRAYRAPDVYAFGGVDDALLYRVMRKIGEMRKNGRPALLKVHCENVELFKVYKEDLEPRYPDLGRDEPLTDVTWAHCRPAIVESESVASALYLSSMTDCPIVIVHLSAGQSLEPIRRAKREGVDVTVETTPLYLENDAYSTGCPNGPPWTRVQPSVKFKDDAIALWGAVEDGTIEMIGTDHAATTKAAYIGKSVWEPGASGRSLLAISLPLIVTGMLDRGLSLERLPQLMSEVPARTLNAQDRKGRLAVGYDADIVLCDCETRREVTPESLCSRADHSPFEGRKLTGWPVTTIARGEIVFSNGRPAADEAGVYVAGARAAT
jgi:dihydroorotase-like cyclic amidohydrolase